MAAKVLTLSSKGAIEDPKAKADTLFAYYLASNYSQTNLFRGSILSLPKLIQKHGNDADQLRKEARKELEQLFGPFFDQVDAETSVERKNPQDPNRLNLTVRVTVYQDGLPYQLAQQLEITNKTITGRMVLYNNQGITP